MQLHFETLTAPGAVATRTVVFLHGILGTGINLRGHARRFLEATPGWAAHVVDLRAHGDSQGSEGPDTVEQAALDLVDTFASAQPPVRAVVGHSFGGKVALALAPHLSTLESVVTLDSAPGARAAGQGSEHTLEVLELLGTLQGPWKRRDDFVAEVMQRGQGKMLAQWLAMNVEPRDGHFELKLDLRRIRALLEDYFERDLWPVIEAPRHTRFHLVIATRSSVYTPDAIATAQALAAREPQRITVDLVDAGHWLHVEKSQDIDRLLQQRV